MESLWQQKKAQWRERRRRLYELHHVKGLSYNAISRQEGIAPQSVFRLVKEMEKELGLEYQKTHH